MSPLEWYRHLEQQLNRLIGPVKFSAAINLKLERITHLLALLGHPHLAYPTLHVGGTSGKGSTATMLAAILTAAGYKTALHTSPHLQIFNERHQIDGWVAPTSTLARLLDEMQPALMQVGADLPWGLPSYFEAQVALSFLWFARQEVDVAVVEVGLGGTLDATNVIPARVAVLTNVGLDHTNILGDTVEQIAADKVGIIKPGQIVITGVTQPSVRALVAARCAAVGATLWEVTEPTAYDLPLAGDFQRRNAAQAIAAAQAFVGETLPPATLQAGLRQARLPGRLEVVAEEPLTILDGAHNPDKMAAAAAALVAAYPHQRRIVVMGMKSDKAIQEVLPLALAQAEVLVATQFYVKGLWQPMPAAGLAEVAQRLAPHVTPYVVPDPLQAVALAQSLARPTDMVWVTGSLYLVGDVRELWFPTPALVAQAEKGLTGALTLPPAGEP